MSDQRPEPPPHSPASGNAALEQAGATPLKPSDPGLLGPYVPLGLLGSGGMGRVYLARPADDGPGLAAVKVIRPEYAEDTEFRRRFQREARVHDRVRTPYAPRLLGTGFEDESASASADQGDGEHGHGRELLWMATQYLPGLNLADAVRDCGTLAPAGAWRLVGELGRALSALAAAGVVHRDLKPSNVLLSAEGVHVIDFGISQAADSSAITITGSRVGTPAYMSPEYLRDGRCDAASDVFSLAGTLVYAVTGHAPFGNGTGVDVMHRVAFEEPKPDIMADLIAADPALAALLTACLAKNPADRPTPAHLVEAATTAAGTHGGGLPWPGPLNSRLVARQRSCELLAHATTQQTGHFRAPAPAPRGQSPMPTPTPTPGFGPATPAGAYGPPTPMPTPSPPPTPAPTPPSQPRRKKPYFVVVAALAVCAVAAGAFFLTRPATDDSVSAAPTAGTSTAPDGDAASPLPGSSGSPSPSTDKEEKEEGKEKDGKGGEDGESASPDATRETADPAATDAVDPTSGGSSGGDSAASPTPAPTRTATKPATPAWISQCTYYSGTELTDRGDEGQRVVQVQCMLQKRGYSVGGSGVDGKFGKDTDAAVRQFQSAKDLEVDGQVGTNTWAALRSST
ncbi:serine/threonine-protein kinase [Streptomyces adelaidensis]|uniref:serine/threonine-protein kinase n=1 Tax=Streptomyces adelaidensis TaxID=2796465 RepID=UPI001904A405|nr:serine/threonine-protein kinase [Streptomyces adelaidensis]